MVYVLITIFVLLVVWVIATYNFFVSSKTRIKAAIQEIGNQLKRQADLIPNLESSVKGYLKHEKEIFQELADARRQIAEAVNSGDVNKMTKAGSKLASILPSIKVAVEDNPELKASEVVTKIDGRVKRYGRQDYVL
jgi:LemA protein